MAALGNATNLSANERDFIVSALRDSGERIDGRGTSDMRSLKIEFAEETRGQVTVSLGTTRAMAVVTADLVEPWPDRPTEGFLNFTTEFSPMAAPDFGEKGYQTEEEVALSRVVERGLREARAIDTEALCVVAGEKVWSVECNIRIIDHGGNLADACNLAAVAAFHNFRRPEISVDDGVVTLLPEAEKPPVPLAMHHMPICVTFAFFDGGEVFVIDPSVKEELVMEGSMSITLNTHGELCSMQKAGGTPLEVAQIVRCSKIAAVKASELTQILESALTDDVVARELRAIPSAK